MKMKMKKYIINFAVVITTLLYFSSCANELDYQNDGRITMNDVFKDRKKIQGYLNSCYGYDVKPSLIWASYSDEAEDADNAIPGSPINNWYSGAATASTFSQYSVDDPWGNLYQGIRKCNIFLTNIKNIDLTAVNVSSETRAGWEAQARTLRALYYLQLIKRYGGVPIISTPISTDHDFAKDKRASFSEVVKFIISDCDSALSVPSTKEGFHWEIYEQQYGIMSRAVAYAIKSEAVTYAASPLWSDGTYSWGDATTINKEALYQCLTNGYALFNLQPDPTIAQNAYAYYFLSSPDDQRTVDKETIYRGTKVNVWQYAGLPSTPNMVQAGPCPSQELVDSYEMANGEAPILGYNDEDHLIPVINSNSGYDPRNPYIGRDPRFYASIYYNGAPHNLDGGGLSGNIAMPIVSANGLTLTEDPAGFYNIETTTADPWVSLKAINENLASTFSSAKLTFEYKSETPIPSIQIFFGPDYSEARSVWPGIIPASNDWAVCSFDLTNAITQFGWGKSGDNLRVDLGDQARKTLQIKNIKLEIEGASQKFIETFVGGAEEISETSRRNTKTGYYIRKYNNYKSGINNDADGFTRTFRLAELYLNFAESAYQSDGPDVQIDLGPGIKMSARDAVNVVRARAGMPPFPAGMTKADFEKKYRNERRIEFAFEGQRFFDVRRWKILSQTDKFVTGMKITLNGSAFNYERFKLPERQVSSDKYLMYPINENEVLKMMKLSGENWQNPGW